jgi:hypothetical protein
MKDQMLMNIEEDALMKKDDRNKTIKKLNINFSSIENLINRLSYKYIETNKATPIVIKS